MNVYKMVSPPSLFTPVRIQSASKTTRNTGKKVERRTTCVCVSSRAAVSLWCLACLPPHDRGKVWRTQNARNFNISGAFPPMTGERFGGAKRAAVSLCVSLRAAVSLWFLACLPPNDRGKVWRSEKCTSVAADGLLRADVGGQRCLREKSGPEFVCVLHGGG